MTQQKTIHFHADGFELVGTLHLPDVPFPPLVIGCHGLLANRDSIKQISLARTCNAHGMAYFRFDHRGCGESQGDFRKVTSLEARCSDLCRAIETLEQHPAVGPLTALFGSSFGGTVVLAHASRYRIPALITYAAPLNSATIQHANIRDNQGHPAHISLLTEALAFDLSPILKTVSNILIVHSGGDETVPVEHARQIHSGVSRPKKLFIFEGGDHRMSDSEHQKRFSELFIEWLKKL